MSGWPDWDGNGRVDTDEKLFTLYLLNDMDNHRRGRKKSGGCLSCILLFVVFLAGSIGFVVYL